MTTSVPERAAGLQRTIDATMRTTSGRALAVLTGELRDFDLAEDAVQDAWLDATRSWAVDGVPDNPTGWIVATARRRAIDRLRRDRRGDRLRDRIGSELLTRPHDDEPLVIDDALRDERLTLLFTCCHPALAAEARVALTLRAVAGLTTREIARAFGVSESTMQQRIVRTKQRITAAGIPYRVPERDELVGRLSAVHAVIYAMFTEGYAATENADFVRVDLVDEAIRLAELTVDLLADQPESLGLLALVLAHDARRAGRRDDDGSLVLLADQDRSTWDRRQVERAAEHLERAMAFAAPGPYQLQAAIAVLHAQASTVEATDWIQIAALYAELTARWPSPAARLAGAVAIGMADGPDAGLRAIDALPDDLHRDHRWHAAAGHFLAAAGRNREAAAAFSDAADAARHPRVAERLRVRAGVLRPR